MRCIFLNGSSILGMSERSFTVNCFVDGNNVVRRRRTVRGSLFLEEELGRSSLASNQGARSGHKEQQVVPSRSFDEPKKCSAFFLTALRF